MKIRINSIIEYKNPLPDEYINNEPRQYQVTYINQNRLYIVPVCQIEPLIVTLALLSDVKVVTF